MSENTSRYGSGEWLWLSDDDDGGDDDYIDDGDDDNGFVLDVDGGDEYLITMTFFVFKLFLLNTFYSTSVFDCLSDRWAATGPLSLYLRMLLVNTTGKVRVEYVSWKPN